MPLDLLIKYSSYLDFSMIILDASRSLKEFGSQPQMNTRAINRYKATL